MFRTCYLWQSKHCFFLQFVCIIYLEAIFDRGLKYRGIPGKNSPRSRSRNFMKLNINSVIDFGCSAIAVSRIKIPRWTALYSIMIFPIFGSNWWNKKYNLPLIFYSQLQTGRQWWTLCLNPRCFQNWQELKLDIFLAGSPVNIFLFLSLHFFVQKTQRCEQKWANERTILKVKII